LGAIPLAEIITEVTGVGMMQVDYEHSQTKIEDQVRALVRALDAADKGWNDNRERMVTDQGTIYQAHFN